MKKRNGRVSAAEKEVVEIVGDSKDVEVLKRPEPPINFGHVEAEVWNMVVGSMPSGWFNEATYPVLTAYCLNTADLYKIAKLIQIQSNNAESFDVKAYLMLVRSQKEISTALASLATKLRITQQATVTPQGVPRFPQTTPKKKPWER